MDRTVSYYEHTAAPRRCIRRCRRALLGFLFTPCWLLLGSAVRSQCYQMRCSVDGCRRLYNVWRPAPWLTVALRLRWQGAGRSPPIGKPQTALRKPLSDFRRRRTCLGVKPRAASAAGAARPGVTPGSLDGVTDTGPSPRTPPLAPITAITSAGPLHYRAGPAVSAPVPLRNVRNSHPPETGRRETHYD